ncbi:hypothetical protein C6P40_001221 [Pichia californica]|uniref:FAS1 domain-containing protein n=1 Tax=Pichia californica TaxID=460514 RepID=A0A9P6WK06_9ASCO|nr:hypothetical protein C6P42_000626 [[Candida] californica]KAG0688244.1 hypothetical protein C6P40_001221 [[Candida] californica]
MLNATDSNNNVNIDSNNKEVNKNDNDNDNDNDEVPTLSIIDILSSNESYSHLLLTLQRSDLIDYVNELENITFLAPINDAFENHNIPIGSKMDKNDLNRFIIDDIIFRDDFNGIKIVSTLNFFGSPYIDNFQIPVLLDHRSNDEDNDAYYVVENSNVLYDDQYLPTVNNIFLTIDDLLLDPKENICQYFQNTLNRNTGDEHFKIFSSLLISDNTCKSMKMSNMTFLIPSDNSLNLNNIEKKYLYNIRGLNDKNLFISNFLINGIIGGNLNNTDNNIIIRKNWNNDNLLFSSSYLGDEIIINNNIHSTSSNYLLSDGIIHYFEDILFDYNDTKKFPIFTPRKYLIGLDYEDFVDEIDFRRLSDYIDNNFINQTIFVSNDYKIFGSLKNQMLYHFITGNDEINIDFPFNENKLLNSKFCVDIDTDKDSNNYNLEDEKFCQKIKFELSPYGEMTLNSNSKIINKKPYKVGNTSIFILDDDISIPPKLQTAMASELTGFGKSISFFKKFNYYKKLSKDNSIYTIFLPATNLWNKLDLTLDYLISNPKLLEKILENLIIKGIIYHDFEGIKDFETFENSKIQISKSNSFDNELIINNLTNINISFESEILYSNGVIHPINDNLPLPLGMRITNLDLFSAQDSFEFEKILNLLNLTSVLDSNKGYSIMLPSSKSLLQENITNIIDIDFLEKFAKLHILPPGSLDMILDCYSSSSSSSSSFPLLDNDFESDFKNSSTSIPTLMNGTHLTCRELASGGMLLSITEGSGNEVRILRHGIVIDNTTITSGLLLLDRPLNPLWMNHNDNKLYLHLPLFAIFVGILIGIVFVLLMCGCCLILTFGNSKKKFNDDNNNNNILTTEEGRIDHVISVNERMPLLNDENDHNNSAIDDDDDGDDEEEDIEGSNIDTHSKKIIGSNNIKNYGKDNQNLNGFVINGNPHKLRSYNSTGILGKSLGRKIENMGNNSYNDNNNKNILEKKGRTLGRRYSTFDARYSMNSSAEPIDVNNGNAF